MKRRWNTSAGLWRWRGNLCRKGSRKKMSMNKMTSRSRSSLTKCTTTHASASSCSRYNNNYLGLPESWILLEAVPNIQRIPQLRTPFPADPTDQRNITSRPIGKVLRPFFNEKQTFQVSPLSLGAFSIKCYPKNNPSQNEIMHPLSKSRTAWNNSQI